MPHRVGPRGPPVLTNENEAPAALEDGGEVGWRVAEQEGPLPGLLLESWASKQKPPDPPGAVTMAQ